MVSDIYYSPTSLRFVRWKEYWNLPTCSQSHRDTVMHLQRQAAHVKSPSIILLSIAPQSSFPVAAASCTGTSPSICTCTRAYLYIPCMHACMHRTPLSYQLPPSWSPGIKKKCGDVGGKSSRGQFKHFACPSPAASGSGPPTTTLCKARHRHGHR